nr:retrovirus-related Pol polyprotein from transposon TNT 1-94 [Tanacetum cinerariifolium]
MLSNGFKRSSYDICVYYRSYVPDNRKSVQVPLGGHFKLSLKDWPIRDYDVEKMSKVPYTNAVRSLMYMMVCTRPDIAYVVSIVSRDIWRIRVKSLGSSDMDFEIFVGYCKHEIDIWDKSCTEMCCKLEGNATIRGGSFNYRGGVYGPYGGCKGSYLAKRTLGRVREVLEAKTVEVLKVGTVHNAADALTKVVPGHKLQHCLELLSVGIG